VTLYVGEIKAWPMRFTLPFLRSDCFMSHPFSGVVLLVEDEPLVRLVTADILTEADFRVIETANTDEALTVLSAGVEVDVLLSDVEMPPGLNGYALARQVHEHWPSTEILITSGREWPRQGDLPPGAAFLAKPCPSETLVSYVRAAAERAQTARAGHSAETEADLADGTVVPFPKAG
jgi:DNA-binding NtrC family response regulator